MVTDKPEIERLDYKPGNNSPNENIVIVDNIVSWSGSINEGLEELSKNAKNPGQQLAVKDAFEQVDIFQRVDLHKLRKAFE